MTSGNTSGTRQRAGGALPTKVTTNGSEDVPRGAVSAHPRCTGLMPVSQVYFVVAMRSQLVKIGYAKGAWARLSSMQVGSAEDLGMLGIIDTYLPRELERDLHERFAADRVRGEWFRVTDALVDYVLRWGREEWANDGDQFASRSAAEPLSAERA